MLDAINGSGFGLTFGLHTRIDSRVEEITSALDVGNIYVNRNQIGAVVGSQPFGGEGLSGTGPKAGGPHYVARFTRPRRSEPASSGAPCAAAQVQDRLDRIATARPAPLGTRTLPGPTGESNRLSTFPRGIVLCLGPDADSLDAQITAARAAGCRTLRITGDRDAEADISGTLPAEALSTLRGFDAVALAGSDEALRAYRRALADRDGPILPLLAEDDLAERLTLERHVCIDTTAAGGNASLLAGEG